MARASDLNKINNLANAHLMSTIQQHCCGADLFFGQKTADKKYRSYLKKGPSWVISKMIQQLEKQEVQGKVMVDVGGGIGALQW